MHFFPIGLAESALKCGRKDPCGASTSQDFEELEISMEDNDIGRKLVSCSTGSSSKVFVDFDSRMNVDCEGVTFSVKLISDADALTRLKEESVGEDSSSRDIDIMGTGREANRSSQLSDNLMKTKGNKIRAGGDRGSEARKKKRKKAKEKCEELQEEAEVAKLIDSHAKMLMDGVVEVSGSADGAASVKADPGSGMFVRWFTLGLLTIF